MPRCAAKSAAMIQGTNRSQNHPHQDPKNHPKKEGFSQLKNRPKTGPEQDPQRDHREHYELHALARLTHPPFTTPKVLSDSKNRVFVSFYFQGKRHRYYSGDILGLALRPNSGNCNDPLTTAHQLSAVFYGRLLSGWSPEKASQKREEKRREKGAEKRERQRSGGPFGACSATGFVNAQDNSPSSNLHSAIECFVPSSHLSEKYRGELATTKKLFLQMLRAAGYGLMRVSELRVQHVRGF